MGHLMSSHRVKKCSPNHQSDSNLCVSMCKNETISQKHILKFTCYAKPHLGHRKNGLKMQKCSSKSSNPHPKERIFPQKLNWDIRWTVTKFVPMCKKEIFYQKRSESVLVVPTKIESGSFGCEWSAKSYDEIQIHM